MVMISNTTMVIVDKAPFHKHNKKYILIVFVVVLFILLVPWFQIRDGLLPTDPLVGTYCGNNIPGDFTSTTNRLYIKFVTNDAGAGLGFSANYRTVPSMFIVLEFIFNIICCTFEHSMHY